MAVSERWNRLREIVALCQELNRAVALLSWDQQTYMPKGGIGARADCIARLERLAHETLTAPEVGELLSALEEETKGLPYESDEASLVRVTRRAYDKAVKVPPSLVAAISKETALGQAAWEEARAKSDFSLFEPHLTRIVELQIEKAAALGYEGEPYDALLDLFEPEMKTATVAALFDRLKGELVPLLRAIAERADAVDDSILMQEYDPERQWAFTLEVVEALGFDMTCGRQDRSAHPFTVGIAPTDVRITTRVDPRNLASALYASIHEAGHGIYEQGLPAEHSDNFLSHAISLGIHESQSRLWENVVGRSRAFWRHFLPRLKAHFPAQLENVDVEAMYRAVNRVQYPSPIRVEADEVNYNLHIFLRFELERALISRQLKVAELPTAWNEKSREYLGFTPTNDAEGVLQDIHWSAGLFGYFPTYSLGTILAVQLYNKAVAERPEILTELEQGVFVTLKEWMRDRIYRHGSRYTPNELIERATGSPLDPQPYLAYIKNKFGELYGL